MEARAEQLDFGGDSAPVGDDPEQPGALACCRCYEMKPPTEFPLSPITRSGRHTICKACYKINRRRHLLKQYGLTEKQHDDMLEAQGNRCAACGTTEPKSQGDQFVIDHDHRTGIVRGLLCHNCNVALGHAKDSIERLMALAAYLQKHAV